MVISMFQSSSPNTILLMSLEASVVQMANEGKQLLDQTLHLARFFRTSLLDMPQYHCYGEDLLHRGPIFDFDETKLYINVSSLGMTGNEFKAVLGRKYKLEAELADHANILFTLTCSDRKSDVRKLISALKTFSVHRKKSSRTFNALNSPPLLSTSGAITPAEVFHSSQILVDLNASVGQICAEMIIPYPPGIPILMPGERITKDMMEYIVYLKSIGSRFSGTLSKDLSKISVVK
jgi:arginine/lysine/ornithine decarboxylase